MAKRLCKTSHKQYEELLNFVKNNKVILSGKTKPLETRKIVNLWSDFAAHINSLGYGPQKTGEQWRHVSTAITVMSSLYYNFYAAPALCILYL